MMARATLILDDELFARALNRPPYGKPVPSPRQTSEQLTKSAPPSKPLRGSKAPAPAPATPLNKPKVFPQNTSSAQAPDQLDNKARRSSGAARRGKTLSDRLASNGRRSDKWPAIRWTAAGFIVGIVFWHVVGFWEFVSKVVLDDGHIAGASHSHRSRPNAQPRQAATQSGKAATMTRKVAAARRQSANIVTGSINRTRARIRAPQVDQQTPKMAIASGCITLVRDPKSRTTISLPCAASMPLPSVSSGGTRVDRQAEPAGPLWLTVTQKSARP